MENKTPKAAATRHLGSSSFISTGVPLVSMIFKKSTTMINARLNEPLEIKQIKTKYLGAVWQFARLVWTANPWMTQLIPYSRMANRVEFLYLIAMTLLIVLWLKIGF
ncbi:hypothetical protein [Providencia stuartii]|uniref:hypothetical protein n=1 Tax=Providencia stuartii TaxID=588 RepID=UPI003F6EAD7B